ncbi:MAG: nitroreductase family protein [Kosmotogaceae bacterium]
MRDLLIELLNKRCSVRNFENKKISQSTINYILNTGRMAPSGGNEQAWKFGIIDEKYVIDRISGYAYGQKWIKSAPLIIALCTDTSKVEYAKELQSKRFPKMKDSISNIDNALFEILNMEEHQTKIPGTFMMLAALEKGIYSTWVSKFQSDRISRLLGLPDNMIVSELLVLGYPGENKKSTSKKALSEITFYNRYLDNKEVFMKKIREIQPSQLYISENKLDLVRKTIRQNGFDKKRPLPLVRIKGEVTFSDGHTRALAALMEGIEEVPVYRDKDELDLQMYEICVKWCQEERITNIADLKERIVSHEEYKELWLKRCEKMHEKLKRE